VGTIKESSVLDECSEFIVPHWCYIDLTGYRNLVVKNHKWAPTMNKAIKASQQAAS
jgi:hypothetical protein